MIQVKIKSVIVMVNHKVNSEEVEPQNKFGRRRVIPNVIVLIALSAVLPHQVFAVREASLQNAREDVFSSTSKLEDLVQNELQVLDLLTTFTEYTIEKANLIKSYVEGQRRLLSNGKSTKDIVAHPVEAYLLVRRLTADWEDVHIALHAISNYSTGVYSWIGSYRDGNNFPMGDDLNGAAQALVRLQDTYQLDMPSLADGIVKPQPQTAVRDVMSTGAGASPSGFQGTEGLSARDMLFLGKHAFAQGLYHRAIEWLQAAEDAAASEVNATHILSEITPSLQSAIETILYRECQIGAYKILVALLIGGVNLVPSLPTPYLTWHDDVLERQGPRGMTWKTNPLPINPDLAKSTKYSWNSGSNFQPKLFQRQTEEEETEHYTRLCRGEKLRPAMLESQLVCRIKRNGNPYLTISPLKIEEESHDPYIVIVHDFITSKQTDELISLGKPKLFRSRHRHHKEGNVDVVSQKRISKNAWIKDWEHQLMIKITRRVELVSGLKAFQPKEAEDYQIANYGLGGLYVPHTDHLMNNPDKSIYTSWERFVGDRIATLMIYLSDVEAGGGTVFPRAGVTLRPKKGAAAFWWNLDRSGVGDENTRHGACAVLYGDKWVSNKWIRLNEQFLKAPCGLHPLDKHKSP